MAPASMGNCAANTAMTICVCGPVPSQSASNGVAAMTGMLCSVAPIV